MQPQPYPPSYYAASANSAPARPALDQDLTGGVCIIGGGYSGLSTGIALAELGHKVVLLEASRIGWGASGRNGGQIVNGLNASLDVIGKRYGAETASFVAGIVHEGGALIRERVARYGIACDLKDGNIFAAFTDAHVKDLAAKKAVWAGHGRDNFQMLDRATIRDHIGTDAYAGGMLDRAGGHMHPLNLALGEAAAFESLGGVIYEQTPAIQIDQIAGKPVVHTPNGTVRPDTLILAGNAYLGGLVPQLDTRIMPFSTQMMATEPLGARAETLLPTDMAIEDTRYILDYYRLSADKRLIFGGGLVYGGTDPADIRAKLLPNMLKLFPDLRGTEITHTWSGNCAISFSRVPQMGRIGAQTYFAHGYSGHGVVGSHLFGRILAEAVHDDTSRFDVFANIPWIPFPGGRKFAVPYSVLGSWWYGLRDRMGL